MSDFNNIKMCNGEKPLHIMYNGPYTKTIPEKLDWYKYANDAGGYWVRGFWLAPSYEWGAPYWWPWDLSVSSGALKDQNNGWARWGIVWDGVNKNLTPGMNKTFPANGYTFYGVCLCLYYNTPNYTDEQGRQCIDFGDNPIKLTFRDGRFDNFEWIKKDASTIYEWSEDKRTITIHRVGSSRVVCYIKYTDDTSINRVRQLLTDVYVDIENLQMHTTSSTIYDPSGVECWDIYQGTEHVYHKDKTVDNCIVKYFGSKDSSGKITINESSSGKLILPDFSELTDIQNYDTNNFKISGSSTEASNTYVEWLNQGYEKNLENTTDSLGTMVSNGCYGCLKCNNSSDKPVKIYVPLGSDTWQDVHEISDYLTFNNALGGSDVNYLQIIFKDRGLANKNSISTTMRSFQNLKCKEVDFIHEESDGTVVYPYECGWGFRPMQLRAAFESSNIKLFKREWMSWSRVTMIPYTFDHCSELTEIQCYHEEFTFYPHNISIEQGQGNSTGNNYLWPYFIGANSEDWSADHGFWNCGKLKRIEPVMDVHWWANPGSYTSLFKGSPNIEYVKLRGLNNMDWDFTSENLYLPKLNAECILFMLVRLADQVGTPYNASNIDTNNVSSSYPGIYFDHKNIRSSRSVSGLKVTIPDEWRGFCFSTQHGWTIYTNFGCTKIDNKNITLSTRYSNSESALRGAVCNIPVTNFTFKVEGLSNGDSLVVGNIGNLNLQPNVYTSDGTYTISSLDSNFGFGLHASLYYEDCINPTLSDGNTINSGGTIIGNSEYSLSDYIPIENSTKIEWCNNDVNTSSMLIEYNENKEYIDYWNPNASTRTITLTGGISTKYLRVAIKKSVIDKSYIIDITNKKYLFRGSNVTIKSYGASTNTSPVTITLNTCSEYPNLVEDHIIRFANERGWKICAQGGTEIVVDKKTITYPSNGTYIYDTDGKFTSVSSWKTSNNSKAVGVAIINDNCKYVIAKNDIGVAERFGGTINGTGGGILFDSLKSPAAHKQYCNGYEDTLKIVSSYSGTDYNGRVDTAAHDCYNYIFPNGERGYLGSSGEWYVIYDHGNSTVNNALTKIGGTAFTNDKYWTSTGASLGASMYRLTFSSRSLAVGSYGNKYYIRPFLKI